MKIIDFERKGNVVRFYLGDDSLEEWWGDDWNDCPYDCNAGTVYDRFVSGHKDVAFPFDAAVLEPCNCRATNCSFCKDDMVARLTPCVIVVPPDMLETDPYSDWNYDRWVGADGVQKFYFGDQMEPGDTHG